MLDDEFEELLRELEERRRLLFREWHLAGEMKSDDDVTAARGGWTWESRSPLQENSRVSIRKGAVRARKSPVNVQQPSQTHG